MSGWRQPHHAETWGQAKDVGATSWRDYQPTWPERLTPRAEPAVSFALIKPQLEHDASYLAALARCQTAPPGATSGAELQHLIVAAADGFRVPVRRASSGPSLETRVLACLRQASPYPVTPQSLNVALGKSAAAIAAALARNHKALRREYRIPGTSKLFSQYLAVGLVWPPLPVSAYAVRYAGARDRDRRRVDVIPQEAAHA